jgi:hypothetical protein
VVEGIVVVNPGAVPEGTRFLYRQPTPHLRAGLMNGVAGATRFRFSAASWRKEGVMRSAWLVGGLLLVMACTVDGMAQGPAAAGKALSPLEQTLMASEKSLIEAKKKDDGAFFKQTLSADFSLVGVDGKLLERQEAVDDLGDSGLVELTPYDIKVVAVGEGAAIVTYDAIVRKAPEEDQGPPPRYQHFSSVWVKQGEQWKLKFHQATAAHWGDW